LSKSIIELEKNVDKVFKNDKRVDYVYRLVQGGNRYERN